MLGRVTPKSTMMRPETPSLKLKKAVFCQDLNTVTELITNYGDASQLWGPPTPPMNFSDFADNSLLGATRCDDEAMTRLLLHKWMSVHSCITSGQTALHKAATYSNIAAAKILISEGIYVSLKRDNGETALHVAVKRKSKEMVLLLLQHGIDTNAVSDEGLTAVDMALQTDDFAIVQSLLSAGAPINSSGEAFQVAKKRGQLLGRTSSLSRFFEPLEAPRLGSVLQSKFERLDRDALQGLVRESNTVYSSFASYLAQIHSLQCIELVEPCSLRQHLCHRCDRLLRGNDCIVARPFSTAGLEHMIRDSSRAERILSEEALSRRCSFCELVHDAMDEICGPQEDIARRQAQFSIYLYQSLFLPNRLTIDFEDNWKELQQRDDEERESARNTGNISYVKDFSTKAAKQKITKLPGEGVYSDRII